MRVRVMLVPALLMVLLSTSAAASGDVVGPVDHVGYQDVLTPLPQLEGDPLKITVVAAEAQGHVFVGGSHLLAVAPDGRGATRVVAGPDPVQMMTLTPDHRDLVTVGYVAHRLSVVDAATATFVKYLPLGDEICPTAVAPASGLIFFGYLTCDDPTDTAHERDHGASIGAVDPSTGRVTLGLVTTTVDHIPDLTTIPTRPNAVVAGIGNFLTIYETTGGTAPAMRAVAQREDTAVDAMPAGDATPDGTELVVPLSDHVSGFEAFSTTDLSLIGNYDPAQGYPVGYPVGVAIRSDGVVMSALDATYSPDLVFFREGDLATHLRAVDYGQVGNPGDSREVAYDSAAFGAVDAYVVTYDINRQHLLLRRVHPGPAARLSIVTDSSRVAYGRSTAVTVTMLSPTTSREVTVYLTEAGRARRAVAHGRVDSAGHFRTRVPLLRSGTLEAVSAGDPTYADSSAVRRVVVDARASIGITPARLRHGWSLVRRQQKPVVTVHVDSPNAGACAAVLLQRRRHGHWRTTYTNPCLRLGRTSSVSLHLRGRFPTGTRLRTAARFTGSAANGASPWAWAKVRFTR